MPQAIVPALSAAIAGGTATVTSTIIANIIVLAATTAITYFITKALMPEPPKQEFGQQVNFRSPDAPYDLVYGKVRKGGVVSYYESTGVDNRRLHMIVCLAGHEVNAINTIYINDKPVTLDGDGWVQTAPWVDKIRIQKHLGATDQTVDSVLLNNSDVINANFRGQGIAYIYALLIYDKDTFLGGVPTITAVVEGKKVYDPRTTTTAYSSNAALVLRDYLTASYGLDDPYVDDTSFSVAANVCDEQVELNDASFENRYETNGVLSLGNSIGDNITTLLTSMAGTLFWSGGSWKVKPGYYTSPVKTLTLDDLRGPISIQTKTQMRDSVNKVQGTFLPASEDWIKADYPPITDASFVTADGGFEEAIDLDLELTTSNAMAQRIAKIALYRAREQMALNADFGLEALELQVGDTVALTIDRYGWTAKEFEVTSWTFYADQETGELKVNMSLRETSSTVYTWDAEESDFAGNDTNLPDWTVVGDVGITVSAELRIINQEVFGVLQANVTSTDDAISAYEVEYKKSSDSNWKAMGSGLANIFEAVGIEDGDYDVRARGVNVLGVRGNYTTVSNQSISIFSDPPSDVTNFFVNPTNSIAYISWDAVPDLDLSHYKIKFSSKTIDASYANAVDLIPYVARPATSVTVPAREGTYFIKAFDKLGNPSTNAASAVVLTDMVSSLDLESLTTLQEDSTFSGTKTNTTTATDGGGTYLTLSASQASGEYEFANSFDLGSKYTIRLAVDMWVTFIDYVGDFDSVTGNFDDKAGFFDGDPNNYDGINVRVQVAYTDDDPSGTPTWSDWQDFVVGDITARAVKFKALLSTDNLDYAPAVRELRARIATPMRTVGGNNITYTGTTNITFDYPFYATPAIGISGTFANGDRYEVSSQSRTGFTITTYTGATQSTNSATIDYVAIGYGKDIA